MSFLQVSDKTFLLVGVANKRSVAWQIGKLLAAEGARCLYSVYNEQMRAKIHQTLKIPLADMGICNVESQDEITALAEWVATQTPTLNGMVHSIAFANFAGGIKPFHEVGKEDFMQAMDISAYSFINLSNAFKEQFADDASVLTISISDTRMAAESYSYMAPVKACLDSAVVFLAKSFSRFSQVRFNSVNAGPMWTLASAGIPGYLDNFLYAEQATLRKKNVTPDEAAAVAVFLLSERASGINAQRLVVDAGMGVNYFDQNIVNKVVRDDG